MRRKITRPYGQSGSGMRIISMLMAVLVLFMFYERLKDPSTWRALADDKEPHATTPAKVSAAESEILIEGPNDLDEEEFAKFQELCEVINDRAPLQPRDMDAYWKLMDWIRTEPLSELEKRARDDIPFAQLWEEPEKYRGQLIYLRLHVRRVLPYESTKYPSGIKLVCESWGWTDESLSFPYVVVFPDPPADLPQGKDIRAEVVFTGYFLKIMTYKAFDHTRGAPLLVGRVRVVSVPPPVATAKTDPWTIALVIVGGLIFIAYSVWFSMNSRKKAKIKMLPKELSVVPDVDGPGFDNFFSQIDITKSTSQQSSNIPISSFKFDSPPINSEPAAPTVAPVLAEVQVATVSEPESPTLSTATLPADDMAEQKSENHSPS